jgi:hypothetical protein
MDGLRQFFRMPGITRTINPDSAVGASSGCCGSRWLKAFAEKLKYTSDGFDAAKFKRSITDAESEAKKVQKESDVVSPVHANSQ